MLTLAYSQAGEREAQLIYGYKDFGSSSKIKLNGKYSKECLPGRIC